MALPASAAWVASVLGEGDADDPAKLKRLVSFLLSRGLVDKVRAVTLSAMREYAAKSLEATCLGWIKLHL